MRRPSLEPCPRCRRHVRRDQARCPFCDAAISFAGTPERKPLTQRLSRAAIADLAAVAATSAGCTRAAPPSLDAAVPHERAADGAVCWGYGPDTGYGGPPWGYCCIGPDRYGACPDPHPDGGAPADASDAGP